MTYHIPVLLKECIEYLDLKENGIYVDATLGGGGHAQTILKTLTPSPPLPEGEGERTKVYGFDQDPEAIAAAKDRLKDFDNIIYIQDNFCNLKKHIHEPIDGILFDLGVSSHQINQADRGFSLQHDGPLDMRMDKSLKTSAESIVNLCHEKELEKIFKEFGEERFYHRIAKAIARKRDIDPIKTTFALKEIVEKAIPTWKKRETVTRIFQALRIAVNNELEALQSTLTQAIDLLKPGGRIVVISYHSLEDRIVKHTFRRAEQALPLHILSKKPIQATLEECELNPRARSAKLRAAQKI